MVQLVNGTQYTFKRPDGYSDNRCITFSCFEISAGGRKITVYVPSFVQGSYGTYARLKKGMPLNGNETYATNPEKAIDITIDDNIDIEEYPNLVLVYDNDIIDGEVFQCTAKYDDNGTFDSHIIIFEQNGSGASHISWENDILQYELADTQVVTITYDYKFNLNVYLSGDFVCPYEFEFQICGVRENRVETPPFYIDMPNYILNTGYTYRTGYDLNIDVYEFNNFIAKSKYEYGAKSFKLKLIIAPEYCDQYPYDVDYNNSYIEIYGDLYDNNGNYFGDFSGDYYFNEASQIMEVALNETDLNVILMDGLKLNLNGHYVYINNYGNLQIYRASPSPQIYVSYPDNVDVDRFFNGRTPFIVDYGYNQLATTTLSSLINYTTADWYCEVGGYTQDLTIYLCNTRKPGERLRKFRIRGNAAVDTGGGDILVFDDVFDEENDGSISLGSPRSFPFSFNLRNNRRIDIVIDLLEEIND